MMHPKMNLNQLKPAIMVSLDTGATAHRPNLESEQELLCVQKVKK